MENRYQIFTIQINRIIRSIHKIKTEEMRTFHLKSAHVSCLYYLYKSEGTLTSKELSDLCNEDKALLSRSLKDLEKKNYIFCNTIKEKRYRAPLSLTEEGMIIGKHISKTIDDILNEARRGLSEEQKIAMYEGLECINKNLEILCRRYEK